MRYTIGQLAEIIDGDRGKNYPKQDEFYPQGYCLFLNTGNVTKEGFIFEENQFIMKEKDESLRKGKLKRGDIVYTTRGTVGNAGYYNSSVPYENVRINSGMVILRANGEIVDARFLYQILKSEYYRPYFKQYCTGSAQPQLPIKNFSQIYLNVPDIKTQHRIADILSAYDNLIENNQKQIKLLEEAAQRLYKEWFVNLRFPGHENTKIVDGVPEGWRISSIYDVFDIKYGKNLPTSKITKVGQYPVYGASGVIGYYNEKNCDDYVTLVTSRGNGSGDVFRTHHKQSYVTNNSFIARRNDKNIFIKNEFTFQLFSNTDFKKLCTGSAQPQLTNTSIQKIKIFLPNRQLIEKYQRCTIEMSEKQEVLYKEQRALTQARNRLLSKLINGTVEV